MPVFTLFEFEQLGSGSQEELRLLGRRQTTADNLPEAKAWLSSMITEGRLQVGRFYRFSAAQQEIEADAGSQVSFCLFDGGRLCPLRIWHRPECRGMEQAEWVADFEGLPGWSAIAAIEPRWKLQRTIPVERLWMGRSRRDWQKRDCWMIQSRVAAAQQERAA